MKCDLLELLSFFGKKWSLPIFTHIRDEPITYNQIYALAKQRINPTLLSSRLKKLVKLGLIKREKVKGRITYSVTETGKSFKEKIHNLKDWCMECDLTIPKNCQNSECICRFPLKQ